jgi:hypothetical protein
MMPATRKRIEALETLVPARRRSSGLETEIRVMTSGERDSVRKFLLHHQSGGKLGEQEYDRLKGIADSAVFSARGRM